MILQIAVPSRSLGPRRAASHLAQALVADGFSARLVDRPGRDGRVNAHLSNSSRSLLLPLARRRGCLVTLHDVVPRDSRVRKSLSPVVLRVLRRHRVVVHSRHAADLLRENGFDEPVGVVPLFHARSTSPLKVPALAERSRLLRGHDGNLLVLAGRLRAAKGVDELIRVAGTSPDSLLRSARQGCRFGHRQRPEIAPQTTSPSSKTPTTRRFRSSWRRPTPCSCRAEVLLGRPVVRSSWPMPWARPLLCWTRAPRPSTQYQGISCSRRTHRSRTS